MASIISSSASTIVYEDDRKDWRLTANLSPFYIHVDGIAQPMNMDMASGANLDSLVEIITFAKDDLILRGVNWENK
jgi:hypothetical protein